jgi:hypothetical protein
MAEVYGRNQSLRQKRLSAFKANLEHIRDDAVYFCFYVV